MSLERTHPISCACSIHEMHDHALEDELRRDLAQQDGEPLSEVAASIPFERREWWEEPREVARLLRYLILLDQTPADIPSMVEHAASWKASYAIMKALKE